MTSLSSSASNHPDHMIDTIKFEMFAPLKVPGQCQIPLPFGKNIRCWVDPTHWYLTRVECSLPKLVFGHNGRLIGDQGELDRAMEQLREAVAKVADVPDSGVWVGGGWGWVGGGGVVGGGGGCGWGVGVWGGGGWWGG